MATLKICVQKPRTDGTWAVYIRVTHKGRHGYIKTDKHVWGKGINPKTREIKDPFVIKQLSITVVDYMERLNKRNISNWTLEEVVSFLKTGDEEISFSDYCRKYIHSMQDAGQVRNARNYEMAIKHLEKFVGSNRINFSALSSTLIERWINLCPRPKEPRKCILFASDRSLRRRCWNTTTMTGAIYALRPIRG